MVVVVDAHITIVTQRDHCFFQGQKIRDTRGSWDTTHQTVNDTKWDLCLP